MASVITVALLVFFIISLSSEKGGYAEVSKNGKIIEKYPLNINTEVEISDEKGYNLLIIQDGEAYIKEASCPDKLCCRQGKVSGSGETLVCLPNKTIITIRSDKNSETDFKS